MKPTMVTAICLLTAIIIVSSFGLQLDPVDVSTQIPEALSAHPSKYHARQFLTWVILEHLQGRYRGTAHHAALGRPNFPTAQKK